MAYQNQKEGRGGVYEAEDLAVRTRKGSELMQRKWEWGGVALERAANGRRPEGFSCPSATAEALGKASKMLRLILNKDLL